MSTLCQPNGMPGRSFQPKPSAAQKEDQKLRSAAARRNKATFDAVRVELKAALGRREMTLDQHVRAMNRADREQMDADLAAFAAIRVARETKTGGMRMAQAA